ncbi:MAG: type I secretion system permease/ATPase [Gammaproteobacteria bacterium]|nr:type I secretion system permease/ATPase [Gammaproteobacteria bacterium]
MPDAPGAADSGLVALVRIARLHEVAADAERLRHEFAAGDAPLEGPALVRAARWLGLKARRIESEPARLAAAPLPAIARLVDGEFVVLAALRSDAVLLLRAGASRPESCAREDFLAAWSGELILLTRRAALTPAARAFGFAWFLPFVMRHRHLFGEVLLVSLVLQVLALVSPVFFQVVIDKVLVHRGLATLDVLALGLLLVSLFEVVLGGLRTYVFAHTTNRIDAALGATVFGHLLRLPLAWFEARRVGDVVARVRELDAIRAFITGSAVTVLVDAVFTAVFFVVMTLYSPLLTALVAATLPLYAALAFTLAPVLRARLGERFERGADCQAWLVEAVGAIATLKAAAVEPGARRLWEERLAAYVAASFRTTLLAETANQLAALVNKLMVLGILWAGAHQVIAGALSVGQLVAFNLFAARVAGPILRLVQLWQDFQQAAVSVKRLGDVLDAPPEPRPTAGRGELPRPAGRLRFDAIRFRYRADRAPVLDGFSLDVAPGEVIGIVGPSGAGKSTLARLLQRLYVPEQGRVLIDGVDIAALDPARLRRLVGVVLQDDVLFNRSVRDNIALVDTALPFDRVVRAARLAAADEFISALPQGYDTVVGEHGATLSGGQRQRIAIARALCGAPRILVFDEATSALDHEAEAALQRNLRHICAGRTVMIIAHRLSALRLADRIAVIEAGRVVELGTSRELLARGGWYAALARRQGVAGDLAGSA